MSRQRFLKSSILAALTSSLLLVNGAYAVEFAEGKILVKPAPGLSEAKLAKILRTVNGRSRGKLKGLEVHEVDVPPRAEEALARALSRNPNIQFAQPDYLLEPVGTVNDPKFGSQWHLPKMQAPSAWQYGDGSGVTVAVLDTGVYANHVDLTGQVLNGWNTVSNNRDTSDIQGHGTWVAGTVAATTNNAVGVASTAPGAKILPVRISDRSDGAAYSSDAAEGIRWAADQGARVANLSYGFGGDPTVASAASYMMSQGGVVVVAAGNQNTDPGYANDPYLFVAAATDSGDNRASYSNYGSLVDVAAPGSAIYTTNRSGGYSSVSGTSFASPNTAAVAALVMAANPSLNATEVLAVLEQSTADLGASGWDPYYGFGRVDALAATGLAANAVPSDRTAPSVSLDSPRASDVVGDLVSVTVSASDDFGVASVTLLVDGSALATETQANTSGNYVFSWDSTTTYDGRHRLTAQAVDAAGNVGKSTDIYVDVANAAEDTVPPVAVITSPNDGAVASKFVDLAGYGTDDQQTTEFSLYVDGQLACSGTTSASCRFNLRKVSNGLHTASAKAKDAAGNTHSASVSFTVGSSDSTSTNDGSTDSSPNPNKGRGKTK